MGLEVYGKTRKALFKNAAEGMFSLIAETKNITPKKTIKFDLKAPEIKELFVYWLRELLYRYSTEALVFSRVSIKRLTDTHLEAAGYAEKFNRKKHIFKNDLKAVTYHGLDIKKTKSGWQARVIFDV